MSQLKVEHNHRDGRGLQKRKHLKDYFTLSLQDKDAHIEGKKRKISARKGHAERLAPSTARTPYWPILCHFWCRLFSPMTLPDNKCMPYSLFHVPDNNFKILGSVWNKKLEMKTEKTSPSLGAHERMTLPALLPRKRRLTRPTLQVAQPILHQNRWNKRRKNLRAFDHRVQRAQALQSRLRDARGR